MIEKWRSFVAITPGQDVNRKVLDLVASLAPACREAGQKVRWVHPSKVHLTLRFLGDVPAPLAVALEDALRDVDSVARFEIEFKGIGAFPDAARPRVIWMGVDDPSGGLGMLYEKVSKLLEDQGIGREKRAFTPHVTLGRVRDPSSGDLSGIIEEHASTVVAPMQVARVIFYRSILDRAGAIHEPRWSLELGRERK